MTLKRIAALVLCASLPPVGVGASEGFRCSNRVISVGARLGEVRSKCGEPDAAETRVETREVAQRRRVRRGPYSEEVEERRTIEVTVDEWTYDFGSTKFVRYLRFENGRLVTVSEGDWGSKSQAQEER